MKNKTVIILLSVLLALTALMMVGCRYSEETDKSTTLVQFKILQIDSCEYLKIDGYYGYAHKGNCRFCQERMRKLMLEVRDSLLWSEE